MDEFYVQSPSESQQQTPYPTPKRGANYWLYLLGIGTALLLPPLWQKLSSLQANSFAPEWNQCRQVDLSQTHFKYLVVRDWLTGADLVKLPHGSKVILQDFGRTKDNQHAVILISSYKFPNRDKIDDFGTVLSGYADKNGNPQSFFIYCT